MTTIAFDTHAFVKRLQAVGFTEQQAEVFAEEQRKLIEDRLATSSDLEALRENTRTDLEKLREELRRDLRELEYRIIIKPGGMIVVAVAAMATLVKLL